MNRFPYFGFPYNYQYYQYYNYPKKQNTHEEKNNSITSPTSDTINHVNKPNHKSNIRFQSSEEPLFEILGIKLYLDDIIILCILFFLYEQNVKDEMLYIILFLLLFS